jgi:hypothetical protein
VLIGDFVLRERILVLRRRKEFLPYCVKDLRESFYCDNIYSLEIMHCLLEIRDVLFFFVYVIISHHSSLEEDLLLVCFFSYRYLEVQRRDS